MSLRPASEEEGRPRKRPRQELTDPVTEAPPGPNSNPFDSAYERTVQDICACAPDEHGYIRVKLYMRWPLADKFSCVFSMMESSKAQVQFDAKFAGALVKHLHLLSSWKIQDELLLSLKGAQIKQVPQSSKPSAIPISLSYEEGVLFKVIKSRDASQVGKIVDTWAIDQQSEAEEKDPKEYQDDWFSSHPQGPSPFSVLGKSNRGHNTMSTLPSTANLQEIPEKAPTPGRTETHSDVPDPSIINGSPTKQPNSAPISAPKVAFEATAAPTDAVEIESRHPEPHHHGDIVPITPSKTPSVTNPAPSQVLDAPLEQLVKSRPEIPPFPSREPQHRPAAVSSVPTVKTVPHGRSSAEKMTSKQKKKLEKNAARKARKQNIYIDASDTSRQGSVDGSPSTLSRSSTPLEAPQISSSTPAEPSSHVVSSTDDQRRILPKTPPPEAQYPTPQASSPSNAIDQPDSTSTSSLRSQPRVEQYTQKTLASHSSPSAHPGASQSGNLAASLQTCFTAEGFTYVPLNMVESMNKTYNVVGVVTGSSNGILKTSTNEFKTQISLTDPSVCDSGDFRINCFSRTENGLPSLRIGQILLLRRLLGDNYNAKNCGTLASYKGWQYALFDPETGKVVTTTKAESTVFKPSERELQRCVRLGDWWRDRHQGTTVHHVSIGAISSPRQHRLICDAMPDSEPQGFFNCTVEVLHGYMNPNGVYSLYVTDYTRNPLMHRVETDWCPSQLADRVLQLEMWDTAAARGAEMKAGEFYTINNARMKFGAGGFLEATFSEERKLRKLDEDSLEGEPEFEALLRRKHEWEVQAEALGGVNEFPHLLFEETEPDSHFRCTVEVLFVSQKDDRTILYVTDYTARKGLAPVAATVPGSAGLQDRVVKIALSDKQVEAASSLQPKDYISIRNLRLKQVSGTGLLSGRLGGDQRLITKLHPSSGNEELNALIRRQAAWQASQLKGKRGAAKTSRAKAKTDLGKRVAAVSSHPSSPSEFSAPRCNNLWTIKEVQADSDTKCRYRVNARIVSFFPTDLGDVVIRRCSNCGVTVPDHYRICLTCDDAMSNDSFVRPLWQLQFAVQDEEDTIEVVRVVDDNCSLLKGLDALDLWERGKSYTELVRRLIPLLGNILKIDGDKAQRNHDDEVGPDTPLLTLSIGTWPSLDGDGSKEYILLDQTPAT